MEIPRIFAQIKVQTFPIVSKRIRLILLEFAAKTNDKKMYCVTSVAQNIHFML